MASSLSPKKVVEKPLSKLSKESKAKGRLHPYLGVSAFVLPTVGLASRDANFRYEKNIKISSIVCWTTISASYSRLHTFAENPKDGSVYQGGYCGAGGGLFSNIFCSDIESPAPEFTIELNPQATAFVGYQGKKWFTDFGFDFVFAKCGNRINTLVLPCVRFGYTF